MPITINVTGEEKISSDLTSTGIEPGSPGWQSDILPRRHKSRLVQQGCTSVYIPIPCDILPPPNWASFPKTQAIENVEITDSGNYCAGL